MTGRLPPPDPFDPIERGRQLRSNYVYNAHWLPLDFSDLLSLLWRYDQADADAQPGLAAYYHAAWEALLRALALDDTELGRWLLTAKPPVMASLPAFVEREAPFAEDLMARAEAVANLFGVRAAIIQLETDELSFFGVEAPSVGIKDERLAQAIDDLYLKTLPAYLDELGAALITIDELLYELLLAWHPRHSETLPNLIAHYGFPNPDTHREKFKL